MARETGDWGRWDEEQNDRYGEIPVHHQKFVVLKVKVIEGYGIKRNSAVDQVNPPNSRIELEYSKAVGTTKFVTTKKKNKHPAWNESFRFALWENETELKEEDFLKLSLIVETWNSSRRVLGEVSFDHSCLGVGKNMEKNVSFGQNGKVKVQLWKKRKSYLRFSLALCEKEMEFRRKRLPKVMASLRKSLANEGAPENLFETPIISLLGSGGGIRAATAMCGVMEGLENIGLLPCLTYALGTSGSSWYLSGAYARQALQKTPRAAYHNWMRTSLKTSCLWEIPKPSNLKKCWKVYKSKNKLGQPFTLVDYYGICSTNKLVGKKFKSTKLSDIREYVESANVPYPILNSSQVQDLMDVRKYSAACNFTPYECELPQYGVNVDLRRLNSEFFGGVMEKNLPEPDLSFIIGTLGSIFGLRLNRILGLDTYEDMIATLERTTDETDGKLSTSTRNVEEESQRKRFWKWLSTWPQFLDRNMFIERTGQILNIARGLNNMRRFPIDPCSNQNDHEEVIDGFVEQDTILSLVDGGILCNVPIDAALRPQRRNDILFIADFSYYDKDMSYETLESAIRLAKDGGYKFPSIDLEKVKSEEKEIHVFEDENDPECPIVFWLLPSTREFREDHNYTPKNPEVLSKLRNGERFTDFQVFGSEVYNTFNLRYSNLDFDRLRELMAYNIKINEKTIKAAIRRKIAAKRKLNEVKV